MKEKIIFNEFQVLKSTPEDIRKQFIGVCKYMIENSDTIIRNNLKGVKGIKITVEMKPQEIITMVKEEIDTIYFEKK